MPRLALIQFLDQHDGPVDPSFGVPGYNFGLRPSNELPKPPGSIGTLPVFPFDPSNTLPMPPGVPTQPIQLHPGLKLVVKWVACLGFIAVPDNTLPETAEPK